METKLPSDRLNAPRKPWRTVVLAAAGLLVIGGAGYGSVSLASALNPAETQGIDVIGDAPEEPSEPPDEKVNINPAAIIGPTVVNYLTVNFDGSASSDEDGKIASYLWDFGDGTTAADAATAHTYGAAGTYTVTLTVTDDGSATGKASTSATVTAPPPPSAPTKCPAGYKANAVDANGNESSCEKLGAGGAQCTAYDDNNVCTNWYKP